MKILYISHYDSNDIKQLSGTIYHVRRMLEKHGHEVIVLDKIKYPQFYYNVMKAIEKISKKKTLVERSPRFLKYISKQIKKQTEGLEYDLVFSPSSLYYAYYKDTKPMVFYTDATFGGMLDYYIPSKSCFSWAIRNAMKQEALSLKNVDLAIYASQWAVDTAVRMHEANPAKCIVINRGANIKHNLCYDQIWELIKQRVLHLDNNMCNFMFLGTDWERKGGPIAVDIVSILNEKYGIKTKLNIIGCTPKISKTSGKYVNVVGYLDKGKKCDYERLESMFKSADFFLLPTRCEAQGISYTEACSWGVPVIATNTGGVSGIVKDGINGLLFQTEDNASIYADRIYKYISDTIQYQKLAKSTYKYCISFLTWDSVGKILNSWLEDIINR